MRELILLRHGKSDWNVGNARDFDRPLAKRGASAARRVGRFLASVGRVPDSVISSAAVRARTTAEIAIETGGWECEYSTTDALYGGTPDDVLAEIRAVPDRIARLMVVGHEPVWSETAGRLIGGAKIRFPTAGLVCIGLPEAGWDRVAWGQGELEWLVPPRLLKAAGLPR